MKLASSLAVGLLALRSSAFLVVPETHDISPVDITDAQQLSVELQCKDCPFPTGDSSWSKKGFDSTLVCVTAVQALRVFDDVRC